MKQIEVYFDGSCEPRNPYGTGRIGVIVKIDKMIAYKNHKTIGSGKGMSSNVAEYEALIDALEYLIQNNLQNEHIEVRGDSNLVINQMKKEWKIKNGIYKKSAIKCLSLVEKFFKDIYFEWIPRDMNWEADFLSKIGCTNFGFWNNKF